MLTTPSSARRIAGKAVIALSAAAALPLTATRATEYVDVAAPPAANAAAPAVPVNIVAVSSTQPKAGEELSYPDLGGVTLGANDVAFMEDDTILIGGKHKSLEQLDASERARLRQVILESKQDLARDRANLPRELAEAKREADRARSGELRREQMRDIEEMKHDLAELDSQAAQLRAEGEDPAARRAEILADLREAETTDIAGEEREAIEEGDPQKRIGELRSEEQQMERLLARLNQLDRR